MEYVLGAEMVGVLWLSLIRAVNKGLPPGPKARDQSTSRWSVHQNSIPRSADEEALEARYLRINLLVLGLGIVSILTVNTTFILPGPSTEARSRCLQCQPVPAEEGCEARQHSTNVRSLRRGACSSSYKISSTFLDGTHLSQGRPEQ